MRKKTVFLLPIIFVFIAHSKPDYQANSPAIIYYILDKIDRGENVICTKYGDGEYNCMTGVDGTNCDGDTYNPWLGEALKKSLANLAKKQNVFIGRWGQEQSAFCDNLATQHGVKIPWIPYHTFWFSGTIGKFDYGRRFVKFMIDTPRKKLVICNQRMIKLASLLRAQDMVQIPSTDWSFAYKKWKKTIESHIVPNMIVIIAGGMCSKVLASDLTDEYQITFIDIGSAFDFLCTGRKTRTLNHTYKDEFNYYKDLLPADWAKTSRISRRAQ